MKEKRELVWCCNGRYADATSAARRDAAIPDAHTMQACHDYPKASTAQHTRCMLNKYV